MLIYHGWPDWPIVFEFSWIRSPNSTSFSPSPTLPQGQWSTFSSSSSQSGFKIRIWTRLWLQLPRYKTLAKSIKSQSPTLLDGQPFLSKQLRSFSAPQILFLSIQIDSVDEQYPGSIIEGCTNLKHFCFDSPSHHDQSDVLNAIPTRLSSLTVTLYTARLMGILHTSSNPPRVTVDPKALPRTTIYLIPHQISNIYVTLVDRMYWCEDSTLVEDPNGRKSLGVTYGYFLE